MTKPTAAATPNDGHQIPSTSPNPPAISHAARSGKYFIGTPTTSWIICTIVGSRRSFPTPENTAIAARAVVMNKYAVPMGPHPFLEKRTQNYLSNNFSHLVITARKGFSLDLTSFTL